MKNLIFLGPPGSGKGSVAKRLTQYGYLHIGTGDLLRAEVQKGSKLGQEIDALISKGQFVDDQLSSELTRQNLDQSKLFILDGYPRNITQAKIFDQFIRVDFVVVNFKIDESILINRLTNRRSCGACGEIYNLLSKPPKQVDICDKCGKQGLIHRKDDSLEYLSKRFELFNQYQSPLVEHYKNKMIEVNASNSTDQVVKDILDLTK